MNTNGRQQQDWEKADARVLGQILASQSVVFALPDTTRIAEFYAQTLISVPGITACRVCLGDHSVQAGEMESGVCAACEKLRHTTGEDGAIIPTDANLRCNLTDQPDMRFIAIDSYQHHFGFFAFKISNTADFEVYFPFISNLSNYVAITLENRFQRDLLQKAHDELERKIEERTNDLAAANERFFLATRAARLGVWDWDIPKDELVWDDQMFELYGIKRQDFAGAYEAWLNGVHPDDRTLSDGMSRLTQCGERECDTEFRVVWPDGSIHYLRAYGQIVRAADGRPLRMTGINLDVTEQRRALEELRQYREHLEDLVRDRTEELEMRTQQLETANIRLLEADRLKSVFLASMSHELRTPLNSIIGFTGIMLMGMSGDLNEEQRRQLEMVKGSANHLLGLINDVLDLAKIEAGRVTLSSEQFKLEEVVDSVFETLLPMAAEKGLELVRDIPAEIEVVTDKRRFTQILINIAGNAVKFTDHGHVRISARALGVDRLELRFTDTGIGIKQEDIKRLFSPFQQVDHTLTKAREGTGLGLYLCKKLAILLGGNIGVTSTYGKGSEFTVVLSLTYGGANEKDTDS